MVIPSKTISGACTALFLAGLVGFSARGAASAGDAPGKEPAGRLDAPALGRLIDQAIQQQLSMDKATPAPLADDAEFLRRAYLDITGVIPPADKAVAFLDSKQADKRARLIDELLASPNYGRHMADLWQEQLVGQRDLLSKYLQMEPLAKWFADHFNRNEAWDRTVTEFLTCTGTQ